jgi:hypothetical protein
MLCTVSVFMVAGFLPHVSAREVCVLVIIV